MAEGATTPTAQRIEVTGPSTLTLAGVNIETASGPALKIVDNASFDVNIILAPGSENTLTATGNRCAGLQKNGANNVGELTISGTGSLNANGGASAAGIGGGGDSSLTCSVSNITINGGIITATSKWEGNTGAAGIGGGGYDGSGYDGSGNNITINGGYIKAHGYYGAAGIGGGYSGSGNNIRLNGGIIEATGEYYASAIGGGISGGTGNLLNGNVVVIARSGGSMDPLDGFDSTTGLLQGIVFERMEMTDSWTTNLYGNATTITALQEANSNIPVELPGDLIIPSGKTVTIGRDVALTMAGGTSITVENGANLINASTALAADFPVTLNGTGTLSSEMNFYRLGATSPYLTNYQVYKTAAGVQNYTNLPNPDDANTFLNWYCLNNAGQKVAIHDGDPVLLNEHNFYESSEYAIASQAQGNGSIQCPDKSIGGETVTFTLLPDAGYKVEDGSLAVMAEGTAISVTDEGNLTYSFTMPGSDVVISAAFASDAPTPDVTPDSDDASLLPLTGDMHHSLASALLSAAGVGIALLGAAGILKTRRN